MIRKITFLTAFLLTGLILTGTALAGDQVSINYDLSSIPSSPVAGTQYTVPVTITGSNIDGYELYATYDDETANFTFSDFGKATPGGFPGKQKLVSSDGNTKEFTLLITPFSDTVINLRCEFELSDNTSVSDNSSIEFRFGGSGNGTGFTVTLPSADEQIGYTIEAVNGSSSPVEYGGNYTFAFMLDEAYSKSPVVIKINGDEIVMTGSEYTIENITENVVVTVEGVTINTYTVTLPPSDKQIGYTIAAASGSSSPVKYGGNYTFTFALDETCSDSSVVIKINGKKLIRPGNPYTIRNITDDVVVTVENVTVNTYTVTLPSADEQIGYTITAANGSSSPVKYGGNYTFTFAPEDGYSCVIKVNGEELVMPGSQYTIENITGNTAVTVEATMVQPATFTVDYRGADYGPSSDVVNAGEKYIVSDDRGISRGKIFRCWISDSDGREYSAGDEFTVSGNVILTADWYTPAIKPTGAAVIDLYKVLHEENPDQYTDYDMNGDGRVNITDLVLMAQYVADSVAVIPEDKITWNTSSVVFDNGSASIPVIMTDAYRIQGMTVNVKNVRNANVTLNGTGSPIFKESGSTIVYFTPAAAGYTNEGAAQIFSIDITDAVAGSDVTFTLNFDVTSNAKNVTSSYVTTPADVKLTVPEMN